MVPRISSLSSSTLDDAVLQRQFRRTSIDMPPGTPLGSSSQPNKPAPQNNSKTQSKEPNPVEGANPVALSENAKGVPHDSDQAPTQPTTSRSAVNSSEDSYSSDTSTGTLVDESSLSSSQTSTQRSASPSGTDKKSKSPARKDETPEEQEARRARRQEKQKVAETKEETATQVTSKAKVKTTKKPEASKGQQQEKAKETSKTKEKKPETISDASQAVPKPQSKDDKSKAKENKPKADEVKSVTKDSKPTASGSKSATKETSTPSKSGTKASETTEKKTTAAASGSSSKVTKGGEAEVKSIAKVSTRTDNAPKTTWLSRVRTAPFTSYRNVAEWNEDEEGGQDEDMEDDSETNCTPQSSEEDNSMSALLSKLTISSSSAKHRYPNTDAGVIPPGKNAFSGLIRGSETAVFGTRFGDPVPSSWATPSAAQTPSSQAPSTIQLEDVDDAMDPVDEEMEQDQAPPATATSHPNNSSSLPMISGRSRSNALTIHTPLVLPTISTNFFGTKPRNEGEAAAPPCAPLAETVNKSATSAPIATKPTWPEAWRPTVPPQSEERAREPQAPQDANAPCPTHGYQPPVQEPQAPQVVSVVDVAPQQSDPPPTPLEYAGVFWEFISKAAESDESPPSPQISTAPSSPLKGFDWVPEWLKKKEDKSKSTYFRGVSDAEESVERKRKVGPRGRLFDDIRGASIPIAGKRRKREEGGEEDSGRKDASSKRRRVEVVPSNRSPLPEERHVDAALKPLRSLKRAREVDEDENSTPSEVGNTFYWILALLSDMPCRLQSERSPKRRTYDVPGGWREPRVERLVKPVRNRRAVAPIIEVYTPPTQTPRRVNPTQSSISEPRTRPALAAPVPAAKTPRLQRPGTRVTPPSLPITKYIIDLDEDENFDVLEVVRHACRPASIFVGELANEAFEVIGGTSTLRLGWDFLGQVKDALQEETRNLQDQFFIPHRLRPRSIGFQRLFNWVSVVTAGSVMEMLKRCIPCMGKRKARNGGYREQGDPVGEERREQQQGVHAEAQRALTLWKPTR
ncbi:hypothetical protein NMY22_g18856 [Coprinellus aureogranulatus]|nr:hypothetical protein NMY22_g18856 [Coprinellus aureogranulatus]